MFSRNPCALQAFLAAVLDAARAQDPSLSPPQHVRSVCAVDLRARLQPPLPSRFMNNSAAVVPVAADFGAPDEADLWGVARAAQDGLGAALDRGEAFRLQDIAKRGAVDPAAFAEMGPIFAIPCLWSNVGHVGAKPATADASSNAASGLESAEVLVRGAGSNPVVSGHVAEAGGRLALTVTYSPLFHAPSTAAFIAARFEHHVKALGAPGATPPTWAPAVEPLATPEAAAE